RQVGRLEEALAGAGGDTAPVLERTGIRELDRIVDGFNGFGARLQEARARLKALGLENLTLKLWVPTSSQAWNPSPLKTAELIQADMAQIGVKVIIVPVEGRFQEARLMDMSHDLTLSGWATDSNDPDSFFRPLLSCAAIASQTNFAHWCNREFDDVLQKALLSQQLSSRMDAYK
ncbi:ABC transporter substrate-binding protein, partial [Myxococcus llanfairpwllgwyngyllgogerychwyrndrobwllllantysiliogogogochensis]|uniref:ABC transporter substrate-binding protein n=1 Tax=Myxococcus llanfairpwllgwyngyllgogerychwyrndrobwllllantysiliogogogochensis TaxID=2590453 RepID=UPI001FEAB042